MPSRANLQIASISVEILHQITFSFIPLKYQKQTGCYVVSKNTSFKQLTFVPIQLLNLACMTAQFVLSVLNHNRNLVHLLFNGFVFLLVCSTTIFSLGYHLRAKELCWLLNCMVKFSRGFICQDCHKSRRGDVILLLLIFF